MRCLRFVVSFFECDKDLAMNPDEFAKILNRQGTSHYPDPVPFNQREPWRVLFDPRSHTFTVPIRTRERVEIPPGALVKANPGVLRKMR